MRAGELVADIYCALYLVFSCNLSCISSFSNDDWYYWLRLHPEWLVVSVQISLFLTTRTPLVSFSLSLLTTMLYCSIVCLTKPTKYLKVC